MTKIRDTAVDPPKHEQRRILLLANAALDRLAYRALLREHLSLEVTADCDFTPTSIWAAMRAKPGLAIVNSDSTSQEILDAVDMIPRLHAATRVLIVSAVIDPVLLAGWARCRMHGYVVKGAGIGELADAIDALLRQRQYYTEGVRDALRCATTRNHQLARLSRRERELLPLLAHGLTLREAAERMTVSYKTADSYRTSLLRKLGVKDRVGLTRYAIRQKIVDP